MKTVSLYALFAILAMIANIALQELTIRYYEGQFWLEVSIVNGTLAGLFLKYFLDKKFIFNFTSQSLSQDSRVFFLYTTMGILTTLLFWGAEFGFDYLFESKLMRYLGAIIGLVIGYVIKYHLDKRYVFLE